MMGQRKSGPQLFNYAVNLEKRVRSSHPLRRVKTAIDLSFVREEVAHCYGKNGNESAAPEVILKMMGKEVFESLFNALWPNAWTRGWWTGRSCCGCQFDRG